MVDFSDMQLKFCFLKKKKKKKAPRNSVVHTCSLGTWNTDVRCPRPDWATKRDPVSNQPTEQPQKDETRKICPPMCICLSGTLGVWRGSLSQTRNDHLTLNAVAGPVTYVQWAARPLWQQQSSPAARVYCSLSLV